MKPISSPAFEFTDEELAYAIRMLSALRRTEQEALDETARVCLFMAEEMARKHPLRSAPRLQLVQGGGV